MPNTLPPSGPVDAPRQAPPLYNPPSTRRAAPAEAAGAAGVAHASPSLSIASYGVSPRVRMQASRESAERLARMLGWLSLGRGMSQLLMPQVISRTAGMAEHPILLRALGLREIASGIGILGQPRKTGWLWSRVAGDVMDLALLGMAANVPGKSGARRRRAVAVAAVVAGIAALDILSSVRKVRQARQGGMGLTPSIPGEVDVEESITIDRSADECYRFWRDIENLPRFMQHLEEVRVISATRSHWRASAPAGTSVAWDAEITVDHPGELLAWHSLAGSGVDNGGTVHFETAPDGRGTVVRVQMHYKPPGGKAGALVARLFGKEPAQQIAQDLLRFKQLIEAGESAATAGQPAGPRSR